jgi:hydrogenase maturation protease
MMTPPRILVAGIGNIFLGDDAFGSEVARLLQRCNWPEEVRVVDFGIRGLDLTYALLDGYEAVVLIDAVPRGGPPGTLYVLEPDVTATDDSVPMEVHGLDPVTVLRLAAAMGATVDRLLLVGCEPTPADEANEMTMSDAVRAAVDDAVPLVESLVERLLNGEAVGAR